jgi:uncharacterized RDD family membrane protein YckC
MPWLLISRATAYFLDIVLLFFVLAPAGQLVRFAVGWPAASPTGLEVWLAAVLNFSVPTWTYFVLSDSSANGATMGKRLLGLRVVWLTGGRVSRARALARTAVKVLPWETAHLSALALSTGAADFRHWQVMGLLIANGLAVVYFVVAACTRGRRSVHDFVAATEVRAVAAGLIEPSDLRLASKSSRSWSE